MIHTLVALANDWKYMHLYLFGVSSWSENHEWVLRRASYGDSLHINTVCEQNRDWESWVSYGTGRGC